MITTAVVSSLNGSTTTMNRGSFSTYQGSTLLVSSMIASTLLTTNFTFSTSQGSTLAFSTINGSTTYTGSAVTSVLQGSTVILSMLTGSTMYVNAGIFSTMTGSSLLVSTALLSSLYGGFIAYSTLTGNAITVSNMVASTINVIRLTASTLSGSTMNVSTLVGSTLSGFTSLAFSTLQGSTLVVSSLAGSTMNSGAIAFSTMAGSNIVSNTVIGTSVTASSIQPTNLNATNLYGSTMTVNSMSVGLTLVTSTVNAINLNYSSLVVTTMVTSNIIVSTATISSLTTNSVSATTYSVRHPVTGVTIKKTSIPYPNRVTVKTSGIRAILDGAPSATQTYTFGQSIPNRWVAGVRTTNALAYSNDGLNWIGLGTSIFSGGRIAVWNGTMWVAVGNIGGLNSIAYSYNGINWTGIGTTIFTTYGIEVAWNGVMWVAVGSGVNSIAYSYDGINWTGLGNSIFSADGDAIAWNGTMWVAGGGGTNSLAYSYNGINWIGLGTSIFTYCYGIAWNGLMWIAVGNTTNTIAYSYDGVNWTGLGTSITSNGIGVGWNGVMWVILGGTPNTIAYSYNGINWIGLGNNIFTGARKLAWNGNMWVAGGSGSNTIAYSYNGINWFGLGTSISTDMIYSVSFNAARPHRITFPAPMIVATGSGTNSLSYSPDGITWTGSGLGIFSTQGNGVATNGSMWVATGSGTNTLACSTTDIETPFIYLPFENSTYADVMGNSTVVSTGSPAFVTGTIGSKAINCANTAGGAGTKYLTVPWTGSSNFTISFWFNAQTINATQQDIITSSSGQLCFYIRTTTNYLSFFIPTGGGTSAIDIAISSFAIASNTWYNVVGVFQTNGVCSLYINNVLIGSGSQTGGFGTVTTTSLYIGSYNGNQSFNGYIDDFRLYNYAVSMNQRITWRGLGTSVFSSQGNGVAWNGTMWVAVGSGTNSMAYSYDGITWFGLGNSIFTSGNGVAWSGSMWVAVGSGTNTVAYSYNGITWMGLGTGTFSVSGNNVAWNGSLWAAVGSGTNSIAYSYDGVVWTGLGITTPLFTSSGNGVAWNGSRWVATGTGGNTILYSTDGITWTAATSSCFTTAGNGVTWNGTRWVATGVGTIGIGYSNDGTTWTGGNTISPQLTNLVTYTWIQNGVAWATSASGVFSPSFPIYYAFNNSSGPSAWNSAASYNLAGATTTNSTSVIGLATVYGDWLQIQSSIPAIMTSYSFKAGGYWQWPKNYTIVGSNDGSTWYPIQTVSLPSSPAGTTNYATPTSTITVNQSGSQTMSTSGGSVIATCSTTTYTSNTFLYFRLIATTIFGGVSNPDSASIGQWYINFGSPFVFNTFDPSRYYYYYTLYAGATVSPSSYKPYTPSITLASASSQYLLTSSFTPTTAGLTFAFWYKSNASGSWARIFDFGNGAPSDNILCSPNANDGVGVNRLGFSCYSGTTNSIFYLNDINYNDNTWRHVVWTLAYVAAGSLTSVWNIYVNGVYKTSTTNYYPNTAVSRTLTYIGKSNWTVDGYYNGNIDDFRIYNSVLTASQVNTIYSGSVYDSTYNTTFSTAGSGIAANNGLPGTVVIQHPVIAVGTGTNSIAYSPDGVQWTGLGTTIFSTGNGVAWNGSKWIACGTGTNTLAYSVDGLRWTGMGMNVFSNQANGIAWNGSLWVTVGSGTNSIAYSADGFTWTGSTSGNNIFMSGIAVAWNGKMWVAVGLGSYYAIAYSSDGITWTGSESSATIFVACKSICWTNSIWVAVGAGNNHSIAYSSDGINWTGLGNTIFSSFGNSICWNGTCCIAVGTGRNTIAYSPNGISWTGLGAEFFFTEGKGICWTGSRFVAAGTGPNIIIYSSNGITWNVVNPVTPSFYLPFDGSIVDILGNSAPTATGSITYTTGIIGPYAAIVANTAGGTPSNYIRGTIPAMTTLTVSGWVNFQTVSTSGVVANTVFSIGTNAQTFIYLQYINGTGLQFQFLNSSSASVTVGTQPLIQTNRNYNFVIIYNQTGTCYFYLDHTLVGSVAGAALLNTMTTYSIGSQCHAAYGAFNGYIDDLRIYNSAVKWYNSSDIFTKGNGVAGNSRIGATVSDSQVVLNSTLDIASDSYYNTGYTEMSATIQSQTLT